jgi:glycerophosphodiester phosphodiesterase
MKFGRNLARNQVPEWASDYLNYKALKKLIKATALSQAQDGNLDLAGRKDRSRSIGTAHVTQASFTPWTETLKM